jgi:hypothetical protein
VNNISDVKRIYLSNRKQVACVYGVIMHEGNVGRIREKRVKHEALPSVLHISRVFPQHSPRALLQHKRTKRDRVNREVQILTSTTAVVKGRGVLHRLERLAPPMTSLAYIQPFVHRIVPPYDVIVPRVCARGVCALRDARTKGCAH